MSDTEIMASVPIGRFVADSEGLCRARFVTDEITLRLTVQGARLELSDGDARVGFDLDAGALEAMHCRIMATHNCKGFSGLLSETSSKTAKYQALNALTLRGMLLLLEAYRDDPVALIVFENVPRIATRGRHLLDRIVGMLRAYGYAVAETTHDCGELGGLAQSRKRFLLVARHEEKVPPFLYEPERKRLRGVGEVLEHLPVPGPVPLLPMHRMPMLQWKTWVRLAFVEAGADWHGGVLGVNDWAEVAADGHGADGDHQDAGGWRPALDCRSTDRGRPLQQCLPHRRVRRDIAGGDWWWHAFGRRIVGRRPQAGFHQGRKARLHDRRSLWRASMGRP